MRISLAGRRFRIDVPHATFVTAIALFTVWYLHDAHAHSNDFSDFLLIEPVGICVFVFWLLILRTTVVVEPKEKIEERKPLTPRESVRIFGTMALLTLYVISLRWVGFDIGTFVYVAATLRLLDERRIWVLVLVPLALCAVAIYLFNVLLEMPLPLTLGALL